MIKVNQEKNKNKIYSSLKQDETWAGYMICDLQDEFFEERTKWYIAYKNKKPVAITLFYNYPENEISKIKGNSTKDVIITMGNKEGINKIFENVDLPPKSWYHIPESHIKILKKFYDFENLRKMKRFFIVKDNFKMFDGDAERLSEENFNEIIELFKNHNEYFLLPYMLKYDTFYGIRKDGKLISVAGTHFLSKDYKIGTFGNLFTHPDYRREGYGKICASKTIDELLKKCKLVIGNTAENNIPSFKIHNKLGFKEHCFYWEGIGKRK